jgi:hypothetical protein
MLALEIIARHSSTPHATRRAIMCTGKWMIHVAETLMKPVVVTTPGPRPGLKHGSIRTTLVAGVPHGLCYQVESDRVVCLKKFRDGDIYEAYNLYIDGFGRAHSTVTINTPVHSTNTALVAIDMHPRLIIGASGAACTCDEMWCISCVFASTLPIWIYRICLAYGEESGFTSRLIIEDDECYDSLDLSEVVAEHLRSRVLLAGQTRVRWAPGLHDDDGW